MSNRFPAFLLYPKELYSDRKVVAMTRDEFGAYMFLLCMSWQEDEPGILPDDDNVLAAYAKATPREWKKMKAKVMAPWTYLDGRWHQKRMKEEFAAQLLRFERQSQKGKSGAQSRWQIDGTGNAPAINTDMAQAMPVPIAGAIAQAMPVGMAGGMPGLWPDDGIARAQKSEFPPGGRDKQSACAREAEAESSLQAPAIVIPSHLPQSVEQAIAMTGITPIPRDFIEIVWLQHAATEFTDSNHKRIGSWPYYIAGRWKNKSHYDEQRLKQFQAERKARSSEQTISQKPAQPESAQNALEVNLKANTRQNLYTISKNPKDLLGNRMLALQIIVSNLPEGIEELKSRFPEVYEKAAASSDEMKQMAREQLGI